MMDLILNEYIDIGGWSFHVIYGQHDHGHFIAIPNWGVCVEAAEYDNVFYNSERLAGCSSPTVAGLAGDIARAIERLIDNPDAGHAQPEGSAGNP